MSYEIEYNAAPLSRRVTAEESCSQPQQKDFTASPHRAAYQDRDTAELRKNTVLSESVIYVYICTDIGNGYSFYTPYIFASSSITMFKYPFYFSLSTNTKKLSIYIYIFDSFRGRTSAIFRYCWFSTYSCGYIICALLL